MSLVLVALQFRAKVPWTPRHCCAEQLTVSGALSGEKDIMDITKKNSIFGQMALDQT